MGLNPGIDLPEDGSLKTPVIKPHSLEKHKIIAYYASLFSRSMVNKWHCRVYLDLFSGAGKAKVKTTGEIVQTSPLLALSIQPSFDKFIFCESDPRCMLALKTRVKRFSQKAPVTFIEGNCNDNVQAVMNAIPQYSVSYKVILFCLADPFGAANLYFSTIRALSHYRIDFLVLIPDKMDIGRWAPHLFGA